MLEAHRAATGGRHRAGKFLITAGAARLCAKLSKRKAHRAVTGGRHKAGRAWLWANSLVAIDEDEKET